MNFLSMVGAAGRILSSYPTVKHEYANSHPSSGAIICFSDSKIIPDESKTEEKIADCYGLTIYSESTSDLTPLKFITSPTYINKKETLLVSSSIQTTHSYSASKSIEESITKKATAGIDIKGVAKVGAEISTSQSINLAYGYQYSVSNINLISESIYIDGIENKFGIYAYAFCATSATQYYAYYYHTRYSNYDQSSMYQTTFLYENADVRFSLPNQNTHYSNHLYFFETTDSYNSFCNQWNL